MAMTSLSKASSRRRNGGEAGNWEQKCLNSLYSALNWDLDDIIGATLRTNDTRAVVPFLFLVYPPLNTNLKMTNWLFALSRWQWLVSTWWTHFVVPLQRQGWTQAATGSSSSLAKQTQHWRSSSPSPVPNPSRNLHKKYKKKWSPFLCCSTIPLFS